MIKQPTEVKVRHKWGHHIDPSTGRADESYLDKVPRECFVGGSFCIRCDQVFCEHCLGPDMYNTLECEGAPKDIAPVEGLS